MTVVGLLILMQLSGMMLANVPAVYLGQAATKVVPLNVVRMIAAGIFAAIGVWVVVAALTA